MPMWTKAEVHEDARGYVFELARFSDVVKATSKPIRQVNVSFSKKGTIRGMHVHQHQWDVWGVASGRLQVCVARDRPQYRILETGDGVIIPPRHMHGFLALEDTMLIYVVTEEYDRVSPDEGTSCFKDFEWQTDGISSFIVSARDLNAC